MKSLIHLQIETLQLLKFGYWYVISSHNFQGLWLLIHANIKVDPSQVKGLMVQGEMGLY